MAVHAGGEAGADADDRRGVGDGGAQERGCRGDYADRGRNG
jgi:hypothetical protein